jgi:hypothetical protein
MRIDEGEAPSARAKRAVRAHANAASPESTSLEARRATERAGEVRPKQTEAHRAAAFAPTRTRKAQGKQP